MATPIGIGVDQPLGTNVVLGSEAVKYAGQDFLPRVGIYPGHRLSSCQGADGIIARAF